MNIFVLTYTHYASSLNKTIQIKCTFTLNLLSLYNSTYWIKYINMENDYKIRNVE